MKKAIIFYLALLTAVYGCHHTQSATIEPVSSGSEMLYQYRWNLKELHGQPATMGTTDTAHLLFYPGQVGRVSGSAGCNRINGTFELSGVNKISFSPLATTRMACPGETESQFLKALAQANNWSIVNNQLLLANGKITVATLQGVSPDQQK